MLPTHILAINKV